MTFFTWSTTASANNTADTTINWREGQSPSSVNNSARAMMAAAAKYRDDVSGQVNTGGSSTAYTVSSNQVYTSLTDGIVIVARMHTANGASPTLNVDSLGAKAIRTHTSTAIPEDALNSGAIYEFTYDSGDDCWYVRGYFSESLLAANNLSDVSNAVTAFTNIKQAATESATGVVELATIAEAQAGTDTSRAVTPAALAVTTPTASIVAWPTGTAPTGWLHCNGAAVSRTTYAALFAIIGIIYGSGNGTTTFNLPDYRGEFLRGWANGSSNDPDRASRTDRGDGTTGDNVGTKQADEFEAHTHTEQETRQGQPGDNIGSGTTHQSIEVNTGSAGGSTETRPRNVNVMWIIKT